ncbi:hypothetical protein ONA91_34610 [Micromonospora sp. DR5-3]|uniref:hypothetical protein n=1 Tax=unclassified Micromonospora TaxID=2617518 RepID=UPI0016522991|nr:MULTISPECIES: hypothetical protein [unclassified Micromonospora]MCW3819584.1 hypothetical protein [Micromonospora sp. DR5-3]
MRRVVAYLGVLLTLTGCTLGEVLAPGPDTSRWADLSAPTIVGVWRGSQGDRLEFTDSGEFYGDDVKYMFAGHQVEGIIDLSQDTAPGSGRWELTAAWAAEDKKSFVDLTFDGVGRNRGPRAVGIGAGPHVGAGPPIPLRVPVAVDTVPIWRG